MNRLVRAELLKVRALRMTWVLAVLAPLSCALWALIPGTPETVYGMAQQAYVFTFLLGVLGMTGEHRHKTITWAFLITPRRSQVVSAKLVAYGLVGLAVAVVSALAVAIAGLILVGPSQALWVLPGAVLSTTLYAVFGVALGALIRNQVAAVIVALVWFLYGDYVLILLMPDVARWLPAGAARSLAGGEVLFGLLFAAYVAAVVLAARLTTLRRDVT